ncbi:hypothetical protein Q0M94_11275 [Deinococcus radiomollis]|uniref:hypothetical protein n=1 Tax=Deinococcus radiomollis TaxID=468916 RepID=UPI0038923CEA
MKSIGPYVISATPPGAVVNGHAADQPPARTANDNPSTGPVRSGPSGRSEPDSTPLHGLDRLTGMPVLLHRLPEFVVPEAIPNSPFLLPVFEVDVWDGQTYAVTELPLAAVAANHPASAALGALRGLSALHAAGQVHGGLNAGQLWQIGREVRLAGAGLPWQPESGAEAQARDMAALGRTLDALGVRPAALASLESMTAAQALEALETVPAAQPANQPAARKRRQEAARPPAPPVSEAPILRATDPVPPSPGSSVHVAAPVLMPPVPAPEPEPLAPELPSSELPSPEEQGPEQPADPPRYRRYRSAADVIVLSAADPVQAEASTAPTPAAPPSGATTPAPALPPTGGHAPIRIGFDEPPALLPGWRPADAQQTEPEPQGARSGSASPSSETPDSEPPASGPDASEGRPEVPETVLPGSIPSVPAKVLTPASAATSSGAVSSGRAAPANRGQPLRIGWEEDHSWRVVKSGPERRRAPVPRLSGRRPALILLALALLAAGGWFWYSGQAGVPATSCCTQRFTVSGSREPVKVTLVQAPPGSPLQPGALIGTAPGTLKFQGVPGRYMLKFSAAGHRAVDGAVQVPSEQAFGIVLK